MKKFSTITACLAAAIIMGSVSVTVSATGRNASNNGVTPATAWKTITKVNSEPISPIPPSPYPNNTNTGYRNAPGYPGYLTPWPGGPIVSGQTYKYYDFPPGLNVENVSNVTFIGNRFNGTNDSIAFTNVRLASTDNIIFDYNTFQPKSLTAPPVGNTQSSQFGLWIYPPGGSVTVGKLTVDHSDFWGFADAIGFTSNPANKLMTINNSWFHDARDPGVPCGSSAGDHTNAILDNYLTYVGNGPVIINHNSISFHGNGNGIALQSGSGYSNITVTNNYFSGEALTVNIGGNGANNTNVTFTGNVFSGDMQPKVGPLYAGGWPTGGGGNVWKCNTVYARQNGWVVLETCEGYTAWNPTTADNGKFWLPTANFVSPVSTTDYLGNTSCGTSATWTNIPFTSQTGTFTASFDATPNQNNADIVIGLSQSAATAYTDLAAIIRFNSSGTIDVRNGATYASASTVSYTANTKYHFRMVINVPGHIYSVYVTPLGGSEILLALNYAFRTEQASVTSLANIGDLGNPGSAPVMNLIISGSAWTNIPFTSQTGTFTASFDATPNQNNADIVIGLSQSAATAYTDLAAIIRFNSSGTIDVRNGAAYASASTVSYTANTKYHFRMVINVPGHIYSVYVTPLGGSEILLALNYAFRTEQASVTSLANIGDLGNPGSAPVMNLIISAGSAPVILNISGSQQVPVELSSGINVFPNPTTGIVNIQALKASETIKSILVRDPEGRTVLAQGNTTHFDISRLAAGMYFYTIQTNIKTYTGKITKQ